MTNLGYWVNGLLNQWVGNKRDKLKYNIFVDFNLQIIWYISFILSLPYNNFDLFVEKESLKILTLSIF